jgi:hypothetical protein
MSGCVNACDCCYQVEKLEEEIAKLNSPVLLSEWQKLQRENEALRAGVVEARQWAERWQRLVHELGAEIQQVSAVLKEVGDGL